MDEHTHDLPRFIESDYKTRYKDPVTKIDKDYQEWYMGTGVEFEKHPLYEHLQGWAIGECGNCKSRHVLVIAAQFSVHPMSGGRYWDCEIVCKECGIYTARSYAEN
jgi:hypothetical protein